MRFIFYIDGQLVNQPTNDRELTTSIDRDDQRGGVAVFQNAKLTWAAKSTTETGETNGYTYLKSLFDGGICEQADIIIYDNQTAATTVRTYTGTINVRSMELNRQRSEINVSVQDNGYAAFINNNRNIEYSLISTETKTKELITPPDVYDVDMFSSNTGLFGSIIGSYFKGYRLYDVFQFLTAAISDNRVSFESVFIQSLSPDLFLFNGEALLNPNTPTNVIVSFGKLFEEIRKVKDIGYYIDTNDPDNPILRIEQRSDLFPNVVTINLINEIKEMTSRVKTDKLYGTVRVGAQYNPCGTTGGGSPYTFACGTSYFGWKEEVYTPIGQCNLDTELDLMNDFFIASNAINDQLIGVVSGNESEIFLVECENVDTGALTADAVRYTYFGAAAPPYFYNLGLNNAAKLQVNGNNFQSAVNNTQTLGGDGFKAGIGSDSLILTNEPTSSVFTPSTIDPVVFSDENTGTFYDGNNNYDNTTGIYVAPTTGDYSFNANLQLSYEGLKSCTGITITVVSNTLGIPNQVFVGNVFFGAAIRATMTAYTDATLTIPIFSTVKTLFQLANGQYQLNLNFAASLSAGNAVVVKTEGEVYRSVALPGYPVFINGSVFGTYYGLSAGIGAGCTYSSGDPDLDVVLLEASYFECNGTPEGGIVLSGNDTEYYKPYQHEFIYDVDETTWLTMTANPIGGIRFTKDGVVYLGHVEQIQHDNWTGRTSFKVITTNATPTN